MAMNVKKCTCCGDEFLGQGRAAYCDDCRRKRQAERNRNYYLANRERILERRRAAYWTDPEKHREMNSLAASRRRIRTAQARLALLIAIERGELA